MELVVLGLLVFMVYVFIRALTTVSAWMQGARFRAYRQLATRYHGRYESRGMNDPPTVSFPYMGSMVRVGLAPVIPGQPANPRTRVVARFRRGIPFRLELAPASRPAPPQPPKGTRAVKTGDMEFDRWVVVQANDMEMARDFLNPTVRQAIGELQGVVHPGGMLVSINPERLLVQVDRALGQSAELLCRAVSLSLILHEGLQTGVARRLSEGIAIMDRPEVLEVPSGPPICKVCGEPIDGGPVSYCTSCNTPHHRDCWEFVGACSIYGCGCRMSRQSDRSAS